MTAQPPAFREGPILFSGPMVREVLGGWKTQSRRVVKPKRMKGWSTWPKWEESAYVDRCGLFAPGVYLHVPYFAGEDDSWQRVRSPYGYAGDRLWVRETFAKREDLEDGGDKAKHYLRYRADNDDLSMEWHNYGEWRPSIFMPRWASRITLEVVGVRVERVQDITEEDARAEGIRPFPLQDAGDPSAWWESAPGENQARTARGAFVGLWDSINAKRGFGWDANPLVWVIEFRRVDG